MDRYVGSRALATSVVFLMYEHAYRLAPREAFNRTETGEVGITSEGPRAYRAKTRNDRLQHRARSTNPKPKKIHLAVQDIRWR
jgi:hypothetical protein